MDSRSRKGRRLALVAATVGLLVATLAPSARSAVPVGFEQIRGFDAPGTPDRYNRVGVLRTGPSSARNILVLNPGTSASAAYFVPLAKTIVSKAKGWQVWAVERRENLLEDHSMLDQAKEGRATSRQLFDYYLGWLTDPSIRTTSSSFRTPRLVSLDSGACASRSRICGGWSWPQASRAATRRRPFPRRLDYYGLRHLGLQREAGRQGPVGPRLHRRRQQPDAGDRGGGHAVVAAAAELIAVAVVRRNRCPVRGPLQLGGSTLTITDPNGPSIAQAWPLLPANLKAPVPATNEAHYGYALDTETSPPALAATQAHLGHLATSGSPRGWVGAGRLTPIQRYAEMFSGAGLKGPRRYGVVPPQRLTIDSGAVAAGNANPAQSVLDVRATRGDDLKGSGSTPSARRSEASASWTPRRPWPASRTFPSAT